MNNLLLYILLLTTTPLPAEPADSVENDAEEILEELFMADDSLARRTDDSIHSASQTDLDMRLLDWALGWLDTTECDAAANTLLLSDSLCMARLQNMPTEILMPYNALIRKYIDMYVCKRPRQVASLKRLSEYYFPLFEDYLCRYDLPDELKYLPVIESALNNSAHSHAGAAGLWQFMPSTARLYGLEVNSLVDERLDVHKSTDAACRFLRSLYNVFGDWHLALAAYNCGPGNVNKAVRRSGGKQDFWSIYPWLPRETRSYVPLFIAAAYSMHYSDEHGICPDTLYDGWRMRHRDAFMPLCVDTVHTSRRQHLLQTSGVLGVPMQELRKLNPAYRKDVIPGGKEYVLVLPIEAAGAYVELEDSVVAWQADSLLNKQKEMIELAQKTLYDGTYSAGGVTWYKVKKGDTLGAIARRFHCTVAQLQRWNGLKNTNLQINQKLKIMK